MRRLDYTLKDQKGREITDLQTLSDCQQWERDTKQVISESEHDQLFRHYMEVAEKLESDYIMIETDFAGTGQIKPMQTQNRLFAYKARMISAYHNEMSTNL